MGNAARRARDKIVESFPDAVRAKVETARRQFQFERASDEEATSGVSVDARIPAMADAIRHSKIVRIRATAGSPRAIHPVALIWRPQGWYVVDRLAGDAVLALADCGDINISARRFGA